MRALPIIFGMALTLAAQAPEIRTTAKDRTALSVTIYQNGLAAIRDTRRVNLPAGPSRLAFADLIPTLRPKSATLLNPGSGVQVRERNYEFNLLSPASLVDASLGLPVRIKGQEGHADEGGTLASLPLRKPRFREGATALERITRKPSAYINPPDPHVLVAASGGLRISTPDSLAYLNIPPYLRMSPTLVQDLATETTGQNHLTLLYTATDFTWSPFYIATVATDGRHLDLDVFATVKNQSGGELCGTRLQLVAGDPNIIYDPPPRDQDPAQVDMTTTHTAAMVEVVASAPTFREEKLSEYPLFTLDRPVSLAAHSEKQLRLMSLEAIPIRQRLMVQAPYEPSDTTPTGFMKSPLFRESGESRWFRYPRVHRTATIPNTKEVRLGRALPAGSLLVRYRDPAGALVVLQGEGATFLNELPATPPGDDIEVDFGMARGFRVERRGINQRQEPLGWISRLWHNGGQWHRWQYQIMVDLCNDTETPAEIVIREPILADWKLVQSSHSGSRSSNITWDFTVRVPARGEAALTYTVLTAPEDGPVDSE